MTTTGRPEPPTRKCPPCGYRFLPDSDDQVYCSGICAGTPPVTTLLAEAQRLAAWQALASRRTA